MTITTMMVISEDPRSSQATAPRDLDQRVLTVQDPMAFPRALDLLDQSVDLLDHLDQSSPASAMATARVL